MIYKWHDISEIDKFRDEYEFSDFAVLVGDDEGDSTYKDVAFGIASIPPLTKRFCLIPEDV